LIGCDIVLLHLPNGGSMNTIERNTAIAREINSLSVRCFNNGNTVNGKLWNEENENLRVRWGITLDEWYKCRHIASMIVGSKL
jgi:hypothetical protein